jgi:hypothetical protein
MARLLLTPLVPTSPSKALESLGYIAVKHGIITRAERDADEINPSDAFRKRIKQGMDALTVRKEMDKFLIKKQELFRFASSMLDAADRYDSGTTQALIARPNRSYTRIAGKRFGSGWQL